MPQHIPKSGLLDNVKVRDQASHPLRRDSGRRSNRHLSPSVNTSRLPGTNLLSGQRVTRRSGANLECAPPG